VPLRRDVMGPASPSGVRGRAWRLAELALVTAGLVLLVGLVRSAGSAALLADLRLVGWGILLIVTQEMLAVVANTLGWRAAFPAPRPVPRFGQLLAARIAGDAVDYVMPTATLGGKLIRAVAYPGAHAGARRLADRWAHPAGRERQERTTACGAGAAAGRLTAARRRRHMVRRKSRPSLSIRRRSCESRIIFRTLATM